MVRRDMVRGYNDQIFFAESSGASDKILKVEMHPDLAGTVVRQEMFHLSSKSWIVAVELDCENIQTDAADTVEQSLYVVDDKH